MMPDPITWLMQHAVARGSRSTALNPLIWIMLVFAAALAACLQYKAPLWVVAIPASLLAIGGLVAFGAYMYLLIRNPDALRSERFALSKMAIERSERGDDLIGFIEQDRSSPRISPPKISEGTHH